MLSALRKRMHVGPATAIATLALVFAMTGGAYAAKHYLITSTKQISPKVLKSLQGKAGPAGKNGANGAAGPAGAQGAHGAQGPPGAAGSNGTNGTNGESVTNTTLASGKGGCNEGGAEFKVGSGAATKACNGEKGPEGSFGTGTTLPPGKTLKGRWAASGYGEAAPLEPGYAQTAAAVSFALPLAKEVGNGPGDYAQHLIKENETPLPSGCTGTVEEPVAEPGNLCVFIEQEKNAYLGGTYPGLSTTKIGFTVRSYNEAKGPIFVEGTWAVTAPTE